MNPSIEDVLRTYAASARAHGVATENGDYKKANREHDKVIVALHKLRSFGEAGHRALLDLLKDPQAHVRCWAATHLLDTHSERAVEILESLASSPGIVAFTARMVLSEWRNGELRIP
jgi:hypothetical protein